MQVTAQTLLEAYILDYLRQVGCEDLACKAGARWTNAASVPGSLALHKYMKHYWHADLTCLLFASSMANRPILPLTHSCSAPHSERHPAGLVGAFLEA